MKRKWLHGLAAVIAMMIFLTGCAGKEGGADVPIQSDSGEIKNEAGEPAKKDVDEQNVETYIESEEDTVSESGTESEERELVYRILFHHPDDTDPENDEVLYEYEYDEAGRLLKKSEFNLKSYTEYEYDASGRLVKSEEYFKDALRIRTEYEYDKSGYLVRENNYGPDGSAGYYIEYENDSSGNVLREASYNSEGALSVSVYAYDASGNLAEEIRHSESYPENVNVNRFEYAYDTFGNLLRRTWYLDDGFRGYYEYVYDSDGNLSRKEVHFISSLNGEDVLDNYEEYTYGESGNILTQVMYDRDGNVFYDTMGEQFVRCYRYEYIAADV